MAFQYKPLRVDEIRLLRLRAGRKGSLCSFEMVHVSLRSHPTYAALSYTWGPPGDTHSILLNGTHFRIRQNLHDALEQITLAWKQHVGYGGYLWVDAICINQDPVDTKALDERAVQVGHMTSIYTQASKVLVWLGLPANDIDNKIAFRLMKRFEKRYRQVLKEARPYRPWWWRKPVRSTGDDTADFLLKVAPAKDKKIFDVPGSETYRGWLGIIALWQKPWWVRAWIYQEATIPEKFSFTFISGIGVFPHASKVRFLCGRQECGWSEMEAAKLVAISIVGAPEMLDSARQLVKVYDQLSKLDIARSLRIQNALTSFERTLQLFRHTLCADPRDKLYAPLCLAPEDVRAFVKPDYKKNVVEVYMDVVRYYLERRTGPSLNFLGLAMHHPEGHTVSVTPPNGGITVRYQVPSWVPNLAHALAIEPIPKVLHIPKYMPDEAPSRRFYDKSNIPEYNGPTAPTYNPLPLSMDFSRRPRIEGDTLHLCGIQIDKIKDIIKDTGPNIEELKATARAKSQQWGRESKQRYALTDEPMTDAFNRTNVMDLVYGDLGVPSERGAKLDPVFYKKPRAELTPKEYKYQMEMANARRKAFTLRDLGFTHKLFLAVIPNTAIVGDEIWALAGGQVLYLLRPVDLEMGRYMFIGESYVHGLMDGEVVRMMSRGEVSMVDVVLV